ncbi:MAG: hypothetical protein A3K19_12515 [Lentisphaerae bacterium RIFOXYB12_FULL_65_16]|nr:MAG: hypothetical protein A3K18_12160 [Lentisphaerae bacterium RIFOXYA12_64_32]OGV88106.1 MAG: hypothetical protein A3K19_12515 [Lentisphaerae bacterium RIFOXYB12_FULL_65_16]
MIGQLWDHRTRGRARARLAELQSVAAVKIEALAQNHDAPENTRWAAIALLGQWQHQPAVATLLDIAKREVHLRGEAVRALQRITGKEIEEDMAAWEKALAGETAEPEAAPVKAGAPGSLEARMLTLFQQALKTVASKVQWEEAGYIYARVELGESRKQQILVTFNEKDGDGQPLAMFYTECGQAARQALDVITRRNATVHCGGFLVETDESGGKKVVMRHKTLVRDLNETAVREIVLTMAREADSVEYELTQSDHI